MELSPEERFEVVSPSFDDIREQLDRADFISVFFDEKVLKAAKDIYETSEAIIEGRLTVEGIDRRWLTVADRSEVFVSPPSGWITFAPPLDGGVEFDFIH